MLCGCHPLAFCIWVSVAPLLLCNSFSSASRFEPFGTGGLVDLLAMLVSMIEALEHPAPYTETSPERLSEPPAAVKTGPNIHASRAMKVQQKKGKEGAAIGLGPSARAAAKGYSAV